MAPVSPTPEINQELFQKVLDQITIHPETHDQSGWQNTVEGDDGYVCGTTRCVAGWALHFYAPNQHIFDTACQLGTAGNYERAGREILGLTFSEARHLFFNVSNEEAVNLVEKYALKGREW